MLLPPRTTAVAEWASETSLPEMVIAGPPGSMFVCRLCIVTVIAVRVSSGRGRTASS